MKFQNPSFKKIEPTDGCTTFYVGHPISSDNGLISQKLFLKSEFFYILHVAMRIG